MLGGLELPLERADLGPVIKVIRDVPPILDMHDLRYRALFFVPLEQKDKCPAHAHHAQGCIVRVEQQNVAIQTGRRIDRGDKCEDDTSL